MLLGYGTDDLYAMTVAQFSANLGTLVSMAESRGVVVVLSTIPERLGASAAAATFADAIRGGAGSRTGRARRTSRRRSNANAAAPSQHAAARRPGSRSARFAFALLLATASWHLFEKRVLRLEARFASALHPAGVEEAQLAA